MTRKKLAEEIESQGRGFETDPLQVLNVVERLEVGPARMEKRRVTVPYRVHQNGETFETELIYRFEEDVFDPDNPRHRNLGAMMGVQPALNYGLFCQEMVFEGEFEKTIAALFATWQKTLQGRSISKNFCNPILF